MNEGITSYRAWLLASANLFSSRNAKSAVSTPLPTIGLQRTSYARPLAARELGGTALVRGVASSHTTRPAATHCLLRPV